MLAGKRKLIPFVILRRKDLLKEKLLLEVFLNEMTKCACLKHSWENGCGKSWNEAIFNIGISLIVEFI